MLSLYRTLDPYVRSASSALWSLEAQLTPLLRPLLDGAAAWAQDSPAVVGVGLMLLLLLVGLHILNLARRLVLFGARVVFRALFYLALVALVLALCQRGVTRTLADLADWAAEIQQVWWAEYRRWEGYGNQGHARARSGGGYGVKGKNAGTAWR